MQITTSYVPYPPPSPAATQGNAASATSSSGAEQRGETGRLLNIADLVDMVAVGNATEQAIGELESQLRAIHSAPDASSDLRQLRQRIEQAGIYPVLAFEDTPNGTYATLQRTRTARPGDRIDLQTPAGSPTPGEGSEERDILDLIGRLAGHLARARSHQESQPAVLGPLNVSSGHSSVIEEMRHRLSNIPSLPPALAQILRAPDPRLTAGA